MMGSAPQQASAVDGGPPDSPGSPDSSGATSGALPGAYLAVSGVGFHYEDSAILEDINLSVGRGEFVALVGPSGCGKSTLLNLISGVLAPGAGQIKVVNTAKNLKNQDRSERASRLGHVSYMQQKDLLLPWRTVSENGRLGLELRGVGAAETDTRVKRLAESFGLSDVLGSMPWQLSGGMRQRVALLRALLPDNPVLLLDEPFGALDAITRSGLQQWLLNVLDRSEKAILLVTHDVEEAILLADRVLIMAPAPGRIVAEVVITLDSGTARNLEASTTPEFVEMKKRILGILRRQGPEGQTQ
ncbi:MAG: ABC transporter ATP-binding protein [Chloroflexi bacterium]|nr:ABC transporter ATP-binding protein [Chloroflexota bacterium]